MLRPKEDQSRLLLCAHSLITAAEEALRCNWGDQSLTSIILSLKCMWKDSTDAQYMTIHSFISMYHSSSKKYPKSIEPEIAKRPKSFLSSSSSDRLVQIEWLFHNGFYTKQQHFTLSSAPAHAFSGNLTKCSNDILNYGFAWDAILLFVCMRTKCSHDNRYLSITRFHDTWDGCLLTFDQHLGTKKKGT